VAATQTLHDEVARLLAADVETVQDPYPLYERMRDEAPVLVFDETAVIVSQHALVKEVYRDNPRFPNPGERGSMFGSSKLRLLSEEEKEMYAQVIHFESRYLSRMNGETHRRVRSAAQRAFTPKRIVELRERTQRICDDLLDELAEQETPDLLQWATRLPLLVIMEMMNAPHEHADMLKEWGDAVNAPGGQMPTRPEAVRAAYDGAHAYRDYVRELAAAHRRNPDNSTLVGALLDASGTDQIDDEELVAMYVLLLFAGHETTANMFGNGLFALLQHRDQWERLRDDPSLLGTTVEEVLRYDSPVQFFIKGTLEEQQLGDATIPPDTYVIVANGAANRDPRVFADPDDLDIGRRPNDQMSFGYGVHFCIGANVARMEGEIGFGTLTRRFPELELARPAGDYRYRPVYSLRGLNELPASLGRDRGRGA
jgi:cytochrome P450